MAVVHLMMSHGNDYNNYLYDKNEHIKSMSAGHDFNHGHISTQKPTIAVSHHRNHLKLVGK